MPTEKLAPTRTDSHRPRTIPNDSQRFATIPKNRPKMPPIPRTYRESDHFCHLVPNIAAKME
jgi:hypothetical protein